MRIAKGVDKETRFALSTRMHTFADLIAVWPSPEDMADDLQRPVTTVRSWRDRNSIHKKHWPDILGAAERRGFPINELTLARIALGSSHEAA